MSEMVNWLAAHFATCPLTPAMVMDATVHMRKAERKKLFSQDIPSMRTAEGRWYEAVIYETMLHLAEQTSLISGIARKGADAPPVRSNVRLGQNGLFYSNIGDIKIRGNGQDLAEFDLLFLDQNNQIAFGEIVTSPTDMKDFEVEIKFKKRLIGYIYGQASVPFLLVSSVDVSNHPIIKRLCKEPDNVVICTDSCESIKALFEKRPVAKQAPRKAPASTKLFRADQIPVKRPFDYKMLHDERRQRVLELVQVHAPQDAYTAPDDLPQIVKKVLFGGLYPSAARALCKSYPLSIKGKEMICSELAGKFSKVVLAVDLPELSPILYFRTRQRREYLKMIPDKTGGFRFESIRTPHMAGFFLWLESIQPTLGAQLAGEIVEAFIGQSGEKPQVKPPVKSPAKPGVKAPGRRSPARASVRQAPREKAHPVR